MALEDSGAERVGRIVVRSRAKAQDAGYRNAALTPILEIERGELPLRPTRAQLVAIGIASFLGLALLVFASIASSRPILGVVPVPAVAVACAAFIAMRRARRVVLRVEDEHVSMTSLGRATRIRRDRVETVGIGVDDPYRTLWIGVRGEGRVMMLDGLTVEEAKLAEQALRSALDA